MLMNTTDRNIAFAPARKILNAGKLLRGGSTPDAHSFIEINNYEEALNISSDQTGGEYLPWGDVRANEAVETLHGNDVLEGYPDGEFKGDKTMSRYEYAQMLYKAAKK